MNLDLTVTISVIIALCAIVSPIFVALINNLHNLRAKKIDMATSCKLKAFENYLSNLEQYMKSPTEDKKVEYSKTFGVALIYASRNVRDYMMEIDYEIEKEDFIFIPRAVNNLCVELQKDIGI